MCALGVLDIGDIMVSFPHVQTRSGDGKQHKSHSSSTATVVESELSPGEVKQWREEEALISRQ